MTRLSFAAVVLLLLPAWAGAQTEPYPDAPICSTHDNRAYHGLWDAERGCHYDHLHGANPHELDDLFGTELFQLMEGEISHPWQTGSEAVGLENDLKHAGYVWALGRDLDCANEGREHCLTDFRALVHQHSRLDAAVRFHSAVFEGRVQNPDGSYGYIRVPGVWVDFGHLHVDGVRVIDVGLTAEPGRHRQESSEATRASDNIWYGAIWATHELDRQGRTPRGFLSISNTVHGGWSYTEPSGEEGAFACHPNPRCRQNATVLRPHLMIVHGHAARYAADIVDPDGNGVVDWTGYMDRYGVPQAEGVCTEPSLDCSPVVIENIRAELNYACNQNCGQAFSDHDIYFGGQTANWSQPVASSSIPTGPPEPQPAPLVCEDGSEARAVTLELDGELVRTRLWDCHVG